MKALNLPRDFNGQEFGIRFGLNKPGDFYVKDDKLHVTDDSITQADVDRCIVVSGKTRDEIVSDFFSTRIGTSDFSELSDVTPDELLKAVLQLRDILLFTDVKVYKKLKEKL